MQCIVAYRRIIVLVTLMGDLGRTSTASINVATDSRFVGSLDVYGFLSGEERPKWPMVNQRCIV